MFSPIEVNSNLILDSNVLNIHVAIKSPNNSYNSFNGIFITCSRTFKYNTLLQQWPRFTKFASEASEFILIQFVFVKKRKFASSFYQENLIFASI